MRELVLAAMILLAGCSAMGDPAPPSDERALTVLNETTAAVEQVETYSVDQETYVRAEGQDGSRTVRVSGTGNVDRQRQRMWMQATVDGTTKQSYIDGFTGYKECGGMWDDYVVENLSRDHGWDVHTPLGNQLELLEHTNVYWGETATIDGNETVVIYAHPSKQTLVDFSKRRHRETTDLQEVNLKNATLTLWVDPDTHRPVQSQLELEMAKGGATAIARITIDYADYNEPISIEIPAAVRDPDNHAAFCPGA